MVCPKSLGRSRGRERLRRLVLVAPRPPTSVCTPGPDGEWQDGSLEAIRQSVRAKIGDTLVVDLVLVSEIPLAPSGKVQTIIPQRSVAGHFNKP